MKDHVQIVNGFPFDSEFFSRDRGLPLVRIRDLSETETQILYDGPLVEEALILNGDIIVGMDGDFNVARWKGDKALLNQRMCCLRVDHSLDAQFLFYLLPYPLRTINDLTYSTTVKHLSSAEVGRIRIGLPPLAEQHAIAAFLDRETARLDTLIAKKERLLALLEEKRTALVTGAATKGLDPAAPTRESGVEWLGEVPAHWEVKRLKFLLNEPLTYGASEAAELSDPDCPRFIRITDIRDDGTLRDETFKSLPEQVAQPFLLRTGDLLFARSGATVGKTFRYNESWGRAAFAGYLIRARVDERAISSRFLEYFTQSSCYRDWLSSSFIQATIQNVSAERYASLLVPVPPRPEQDQLVDHLDSARSEISSLSGGVRDAIALLSEYCTALISAAVTGQIDVSGGVDTGWGDGYEGLKSQLGREAS